MSDGGNGSEESFDIGRFRPVPVFAERVSAYWKFVWKCWRTALDWTVLLYIVVPAIWIFGGIYLDWLRHPPVWLEGLPPALPLAVVGYLSCGGRLRTFTESGDGLFLNRYRKWTRGFTAMGLTYAAMVRCLRSLLAIWLLLPVWRYGNVVYSTAFLVSLTVFAVLWGMVWMLVRDVAARAASGWWRTILLLAVRMAGPGLLIGAVLIGSTNTAVWWSIIVCTCLLAVGLGRQRMGAQGTFLHELETEKDAFGSAVGWLLQDSMERKKRPKLIRPVFLSGSVQWFKRRGTVERLAESWIKSLLRQFENMRLMLFFTVLGAAAVWLVPIGLSFAVWLVLPLLLAGWLQGQWRHWLTEDFVSLFRWEETTLDEAGEKARFWLIVPVVCVWGVEIGCRLGILFGGDAWIGAAAIPAAGWIWIRTMNGVVTAVDRLRRVTNDRKKGRSAETADA